MHFPGLAPFTLLLVSLSDLQDVPASYECLRGAYYGTYGIRRAFILGIPVRLQEEEENLVWIQREPWASPLLAAPFESEFDRLLGHLRRPTPLVVPQDSGLAPQVTLKTAGVKLHVLSLLQDGAVLAANNAVLRSLEATKLPSHWRYSFFPASPLPLIPVPPRAKDRLRRALATIRYNHIVASIVNGISVHRLRAHVTRHSFSEDAPRAAAWLKTQFEVSGALCELKPFQQGYAPNVICHYPGSEVTTETIVLGAHYDDRGSFGSVRAPGANDDASGTAALLAIAHAIARRGVVFKANVMLCAFAGEERGMVGSRAFARELREQGVNVTLMIQADMLAYRVAGEPPQLGLSDPALVGTAELTQILANVSAIYSPELKVGYLPYPGGSDHESFHENGFPAAQVCERAGYTKDPMYHNSGDVSERDGYDFEQIRSIAKVQLATVLHVAGFDVPERIPEAAGDD
ncbi:Zn-dependent exopeptidase [Pilatotrama ljubarskyi]|nr:Zn-dependent exopeptidase [Pilatotrama ljubarskyi]